MASIFTPIREQWWTNTGQHVGSSVRLVQGSIFVPWASQAKPAPSAATITFIHSGSADTRVTINYNVFTAADETKQTGQLPGPAVTLPAGNHKTTTISLTLPEGVKPLWTPQFQVASGGPVTVEAIDVTTSGGGGGGSDAAPLAKTDPAHFEVDGAHATAVDSTVWVARHRGDWLRDRTIAYGPTPFKWGGFTWVTRSPSFKPGGPAANQLWGNALQLTDSGGLRFSTSNPTGRNPVSIEAVSQEAVGYGTFEFSYHVEGMKMRDLHKHLVWGVFTFDWEDPNPGYGEIDFVEDSYWGGQTDMVGTYTYYPGDETTAQQLPRRPWTANGTGAFVRVTWLPGSVKWETWESPLTEEQARKTPASQGGYFSGTLTKDVPGEDPSRRIHINLWAYRGDGGWESIPATRMVLDDFVYSPLDGSRIEVRQPAPPAALPVHL